MLRSFAKPARRLPRPGLPGSALSWARDSAGAGPASAASGQPAVDRDPVGVGQPSNELFEVVAATGPEAEILADQAAVPLALATKPVIPGQELRRDVELGGEDGDAARIRHFIPLGKAALGLHELELEGASQSSRAGHPCQQGQFV